MAERTYHEQVNIENEQKLREKLKEFPDFCKDFFRGIEANTSSRTRISYAYDLGIFFDFLKETNPEIASVGIKKITLNHLENLKSVDIEEYLDYLKYYVKDGVEHTNDERGKARKLSSLKTFFNYFFKKEMLPNNPVLFVSTPKIHDKNIIRLDTDEIAMLLDSVEQGDKLTKNQKTFHNKTKLRDLALLTLLLGTGIRVSECVGIDLKDIDFKNGGIKIRRKGGNEVIIYFGPEVEIALLNYLEERELTEAVPGHENALFLSLQKKRISVRSVEKLVKKYAQTVTQLKKITPHKLRSTYGTALYKETGDIYLVADVLGHKDVNTTRKHYAAIDEERRRYAADKVRLREEQG